MDATADVSQSARVTTRETPRWSQKNSNPPPGRTPGTALVQALSEYPSTLLWEELRQLLPRDLAAKVFDAVVDTVVRS